MPNRRNRNSPPPQSNNATAHGGASENAQLQWVLQNQNELFERTAVVETKIDAIADTLTRIETKLDTVDGKADKNSNKLLVAATAVIVGTAVASFFIYGKFGEIYKYMKQTEAKPTVTVPAAASVTTTPKTTIPKQ